jgi:pantoate kinase
VSNFVTAAVGNTAAHHHGFLNGFTWSDGATIIAAALAAVIAVAGYTVQRKITRRSERADLYGNAIGAVEAYLEGPYRIRRKTGSPENWFSISSALSDAKTAISHHQALLQMHAPTAVSTAYDQFARAAIVEAGPQMTAAWDTPAIAAATDVPLGTGYDRTGADAARAAMVTAMADDLRAIGSWWRVWR